MCMYNVIELILCYFMGNLCAITCLYLEQVMFALYLAVVFSLFAFVWP